MSIRWDALLTRHLARVLDAELAGAELRGLRMDGGLRDLFLFFRDRTLVWRLHPTRGQVLVRPAAQPAASDLRHVARVRRVVAPPDERWLRMELIPRKGGPAHDLVVELLGNQWNAVVVETSSGVVRHVLWTRPTGRGHRVGARYQPPETRPRRGIDGGLDLGAWRALLGAVPVERRHSVLVRDVAWTSPLVAPAFLGLDLPVAEEEQLARGHDRWIAAVTDAGSERTFLLEVSGGLQPYPIALPGIPGAEAPDLWTAFERAATSPSPGAGPDGPSLLDPDLVARLDDARGRARRRVVQLEEAWAALGSAHAAETQRGLGDLILARYGEIRAGAREAVLTGFDGIPVRIDLDPALAPHENAARHYEEAARIERGRERLPGLIREARSAWERLEALAAGARDGACSVEAIRAALPETTTRAGRGREEVPLPYRVFRSSGGLEIRVGRGARQNDELTFRHAAPDDVWLHARHAQGAHVVLRWRGPGRPPARDLEEAGVLAALHSRARTSGSVPVDWTLRKYVRKPRGAPPGSVVPERVETLFVRPDATLERRLTPEG